MSKVEDDLAECHLSMTGLELVEPSHLSMTESGQSGRAERHGCMSGSWWSGRRVHAVVRSGGFGGDWI